MLHVLLCVVALASCWRRIAKTPLPSRERIDWELADISEITYRWCSSCASIMGTIISSNEGRTE